MKQKTRTDPKSVSYEYKKGAEFKASLGRNGIFEQSKRNERFYIGDQWHGAKCGGDRPLVCRNILKRIGEYKMSVVTAPPISVNYSADGIPNTVEIKEQSAEMRQELIGGDIPSGSPDNIEIATITSALSDYFRTTSERLKFDAKKEQVLRNAYISGTGLLFTFWDDTVETGLYADEARETPIKGDISCEVLDVENVNIGDPYNDDGQSQPYITIAQRRDIEDVRRETRRNHLPAEEIIPDRGENQHYAGDRGEDEPTDSTRVTVYTKLYKEYDTDDKTYKVMAVRTTEKAYVRKPWCLEIRNYPIAKFVWERRRSSAYGESEITYLIPNQIAINRALTSAVWGLVRTGMPIMLVNGDIVDGEITNDPGQIIKIYGDANDVAGAVRYVQPPNSTTQFQNIVNDLCANTLADSGANDAALGNLRPDNAAAIIQMREAATAPMQVYMNRFYDFVEDVARIWADFWINLYGNRRLKIEDRLGTQYIAFNAERYRNLIFSARIDVGAATMYSEAVVISTLDALLSAGIITPLQYFERMPSGMIPDITGLIEDLKAQRLTPPTSDIAGEEMGEELTDEEILSVMQQSYPEQFAKLNKLPRETQAQMIAELRGSVDDKGYTNTQETQEVGDI